MNTKTVATTLAEFLSGLNAATIPAEVQTKARACLLNGYGIGIGCYRTPYHTVARAAALALDGQQPGGATIFSSGERTSIGAAVLANGALFHGRAQEDACGAAHLGAIMIPLLTAMIESKGYKTANLLPALVAGYEAGGLFEETYAVHTTPIGFRASTLYGTIAAAAAAARLMELDVVKTAAALANAVSFSGGLLQSFADGTDEWRYQVGMVANVGRHAAALAAAGSVSAPHAFEGPKGLVMAFARTPCDTQALLSRLGSSWQTQRVAFKPFPVCAFNQTPVSNALELREDLAVDQIESIEVRMNPYECGYAGMDAVGPFNSISGTLMSIPFCIATTLVHGAPTMKRMTDYDDPQVQRLVAAIKLIPDDTVKTLCCRIDMRLRNGRQISRLLTMTAADYAYDLAQVSRMVRGIGEEEGVPMPAYDRLESFVTALPQANLDDVLSAFALLPCRDR